MLSRTAQLLLSTIVVASGCASDLGGPDEFTDPVIANGGGDDDGGQSDDETAATGLTPTADERVPEALLACDLDFACEHPLELVRGDKAAKYVDSDVCALAALADGQIALIQTVAIFPTSESYLDHVIDPKGGVLRQAHGYSNDRGLWQKPVERCRLQGFAFFADCASNFDARCLDPAHWIVDGSCEALGSLTCPAP